MKRDIRFSEKLLVFGYAYIFLFMIVQDLIPLGTLNDVEAIASLQSFSETLAVTAVGVVQILLLMGGILFFIGKRYPVLIRIWLIVHPSCIFLGALVAWWIPYLFGIGVEERATRYNAMFGDTHAFLPVMNGIVPNTLHTTFHFVLFVCIMLTVYIFVTGHKRTGTINKSALAGRKNVN
ncbi:hypothetical protein [Lentibacillus salicampi]|uniref:Uncharacterized protein n=1 Tax=Lentibacillus salicampi TaxID=175306 RepID=A0A4Y9A9M9_9BACI|nr:hypothetical protein [Lentibacillus salicampi]TFJ91857.1 hypothetical protein E4U82_15520 [Lentibacillus salicampi]